MYICLGMMFEESFAITDFDEFDPNSWNMWKLIYVKISTVKVWGWDKENI